MSARDVVLIGVILFSFAMGFFVINYVMSVVVDELTSIEEINQSTQVVDSFESVNTIANRLDYVILGVFFALILGLIITGWFIGGNPIYMFIYFIFVVIAVILGSILANVWEEVTQMSTFGSTIASFPISNNILLRLPIYLAVIGFIGIVVMFAKPYFEQ